MQTYIARQHLAIKPESVHAYFDRVAFWIKTPADKAALDYLQSNSGHCFHRQKAARFDKSYRQWVDLKQPNQNALAWIADRNDAYINRAEVALDAVFSNWADRDDARDFLDWSIIRNWHGQQRVVIVGERNPTRYDGSRYARNSIKIYPCPHSRVTGELHCLHIEWRLNDIRAMRRAGINSGSDLLEFNHRKFWEKRLLLLEVEPERLGRLLNNRNNQTRNRQPRFVTYSHGKKVNVDGRMGAVVVNSVSSIQELIDRYGSEVRLKRVMRSIGNEGWLPGSDDKNG